MVVFAIEDLRHTEDLEALKGQFRSLCEQCASLLAKLKEEPQSIQIRQSYWGSFLKWLCQCRLELSEEAFDHYLEVHIKAFDENSSSKSFIKKSILILKEFFLRGTIADKHLLTSLIVRLRHDSIAVQHLAWLRHIKELSEATLVARERMLSRFMHFLEVYKANLEDINIQLLNEFYKAIDATASVKSHTNCCLSVFFSWLNAENIVSRDLRSFIRKVKYTRKSVARTFSEADLIKLLDAADLNKSPKGLRDKAILMLLISAAMRRSDIVELKLDDLTWTENSVSVSFRYHKGQNPQQFILPDAVGNALFDYIDKARPKTNLPNLFVTMSDKCQPLGADCVSAMIRALIKKAGLYNNDGPNGPHKIRASIATISLASGSPLHAVSSLLGHSSIESTDSYFAYNLSGLKKCALEIVPFKSSIYLQHLKKEGLL